MRIAYVNADCGIPVFGDKGGSVHIQEMLRAFGALDCELRVVATRLGENSDPEQEERVIVVPGPGRAATDPSGREGKERGYIAAAEAVGHCLDALYREWPFDMIYERYSLWSVAGIRAGARLGVPVIVEVNAPLVPEQEAYRELVLADVARQVEAEVMCGADALACVSTEVGRYARSKGAAQSRVHVIGNAVDTDRFHPGVTPENGFLPADRFVIGFTGSLKKWHGIDILLEAFRQIQRQMPHAHLLVVGDGPKRGWVEGFLQGAGLTGSATLTGWVDHSHLPGLIAAMDVATAPYPARDDFYFSPLKLYEYLAVGTPVAASRIGQIAEIVRDGESGLLLGPGDPQALANALLRIGQNSDLAGLLSAGAAAEGARHSWVGNAGRVIGIARALKVAA